MRVLHVTSSVSPCSGGPVVALQGLAEAQLAQGINVSIFSTFLRGDDNSLAERLRRNGASVTILGPTYDRHLKWYPGIRAQLRPIVDECDIVHVHGIWEEAQHQAASAAWRRNIPFILRPCGMLDPWSLSQGSFRKKLYLRLRLRHHLEHAAALHFTTSEEAELAEPLELKTPTIVEPNGLDLYEFEDLPQKGTFRSAHPELEDRPFILFLSRLHYKKGLDILLQAFAQMKRTDAHLVIAGPDNDGYRTELDRMISRENLAGRVHVVGSLSGVEKIAALHDADLFVLPSRQENFGNVVIEALACGTPVLISDKVNLREVIEEEMLGAVIPLCAVEWAEVMDAWLNSSTRREETGARGRPFALREFNWETIAERWTRHYEDIISQAATRNSREYNSESSTDKMKIGKGEWRLG